MSSIRKNIPNTLTLLNLLSGGIAATFVAMGDFEGAILFTGFSLVFDLLDGVVARLLKVKSDLGKDLDSLADMVSFGFTPSLLLYMLIANAGVTWVWLPYLGFIPMLAAAWRLASFNQASNQTHSFRGLPTPAAAIVIMTLPLMRYSPSDFLSGLVQVPAFLFFMALITGVLMVSPLRLFSLKMSRFDVKPNIHRYLMVLSMVVVMIFWWPISGVLFLLLYIGISLLFRKQVQQDELMQ